MLVCDLYKIANSIAWRKVATAKKNMNATICFNSVEHYKLAPLFRDPWFADLNLLVYLGCGVFASTQPMISWSYQAAAIAKYFFAVFHQLHLNPWEQLKMKKTGICIVLSISDVCTLLIVWAEHNVVVESEIEQQSTCLVICVMVCITLIGCPRWSGQTLLVDFNQNQITKPVTYKPGFINQNQEHIMSKNGRCSCK